MAKKIDPFDKFKAATLGRTGELIDAISTKRVDDTVNLPADPTPVPESKVSETVLQTPAKISKNADRELVSFHIAKDIKRKLGLLKYQSERSFGELYSEAIEDLLKKYKML